MNEFNRLAAESLLNSLPAGIAIALFAWLVSRVLRRSGSGIRFAIWFAALSAIVLFALAGTMRDASYQVPSAYSSSALTLPDSVARYLIVAWAFGATLGLLHVALGLSRLRRIRTACAPVDLDGIDPVLRASLAEAQLHRKVTLCASDAVRVPAALGYFRPVVVFPTWAVAQIPVPDLNAILLHEMAHLRRYDDWTNLAQKVVKAIFFFHPAVWFIESRLTLEREMACDDAVLAANFSPRAYAESLVALAEQSFLRRGIALAQAAVGHVHQMKVRLAEILRKDRVGMRNSRIARPALALLTVATLIGAYGMVRGPRVIAFSSDSATLAATSRTSADVSAEWHLQSVNVSYSGASLTTGDLPRPHKVTHPRAVATAKPAIRREAFGRLTDDPTVPAVVLATGATEFSALPVVLVFQGEQIGPDGPVLWQVTVFRLSPVQYRILRGEIPKQI